MGEEFQAAQYVTAPQINVASGVALAIKLLNRVPPKPAEGAREAAKELRTATRRVQSHWAKQKPRAKVDQRPFDNAADVSWGALGDRLEAQSVLPTERHPLARRAGELLDALELRDRSWLHLKYEQQWGEGQRRLDRIAAEGLRKDIDAAAGEGFLGEVEFAHAAYGAAIGMTGKHDDVEDNVAMIEPLRALAAAIAEYGLQLGAMYRKGDEETRKGIRKGLRPIDEHRARYARGGGAGAATEAGDGEGEEAVTATTAVPEVK